jgi:hypothetical protein
MQAQSFEQRIGKSSVVEVSYLIGEFGSTAGRNGDSTFLSLEADRFPVASPLIAAGVEKKDDVARSAFPKLLDYIANLDPRPSDIAGVGIHREEIVLVAVSPAVTGEKEPEVITRLEEGLIEAYPEKAKKVAIARPRLDRWAEICLDRFGILGKEIDGLEASGLFEERSYSLRILLGIVKRRQVVILVDADANRPVLAHGMISTRPDMCASLSLPSTAEIFHSN